MHFGCYCHPQVSITKQNRSTQMSLIHKTLYHYMASLPALFNSFRIPRDSGHFPYKTSTQFILQTIKIEYYVGPLDNYIIHIFTYFLLLLLQ